MEFSGLQAARVQALLLRAGVGFCRCAQAVPSSCSSARSTDHPSHIIRYMRLARPCTHMDARSEFDVGHIAGLPTHVSAAADRTARNVLRGELGSFAAPQPSRAPSRCVGRSARCQCTRPPMGPCDATPARNTRPQWGGARRAATMRCVRENRRGGHLAHAHNCAKCGAPARHECQRYVAGRHTPAAPHSHAMPKSRAEDRVCGGSDT